MKKSIWPSAVKGSIIAPPSKSAAQRAIAIASIANGMSEIVKPGTSDDVLSLILVCRSLGADLSFSGNSLFVRGGFRPAHQTLNCGESGLCLRMFAGIVSLFDTTISITGSGTLLHRPLSPIQKALESMGVTYETNSGKLPIIIRGPIRGKTLHIDASETSQILSGILIASVLANSDIEIRVSKPKSKPYIDLTIEIMEHFGVTVEREGYDALVIKNEQSYKATNYTVEGDWSGSAFILVAGAVNGAVSVHNLKTDSKQADRRILDALILAGAKVHIKEDVVLTEKTQLHSFNFDATDCPDLFPPLVVLAANCKGESRISGTERLRTKESDRLVSLINIFKKMGVNIRAGQNTMFIEGGTTKGATVDAHNDHRIAMAAATAALSASGPVHIEDADAVTKSYPGFFTDLDIIKTNKQL